MRRVTKEAPPAKASERRRLSKLFRVLVLGGAVLAAANVARLEGNTGAAEADGGEDGGGGAPGW